ncbi:MAG: response regulator transcription factor [Chloracidobacterium sp.]|nr:response regulator transcription factor [Chloracidobacterium sp.]
METRTRILVVDDEAPLLRVLRRILATHNYSVRTAEDGEAALEVFDEWRPDLVLTDLQMPNMDGLALCKRLRAISDLPLVVLSVKDEEKTVVEALDAGVDDYITKPFGTDELVARIRSVLRRAPAKEKDIIQVGGFNIDIAAHRATLNNEVLKLTPKEFDLLVCFVKNPERVLTHTQLLRAVWGEYYSEQADALRVLVAYLRKKIEDEPANPKYLITEPWIGYRFVPGGDPLA